MNIEPASAKRPPVTISEWLCPDHGGYAASRYHARMKVLGATGMTTVAALGECTMWNWPSRIKIKPNGKFHDIVQLDYRPSEKKEAKFYDEIDIPF